MIKPVQLLLPLAVEPPTRVLPRVLLDGELVEAMAELLLQTLAVEEPGRGADAPGEVTRDSRS